MALAHTVSDKVEAAYRRGDLLEKRYRLMEEWAGFCAVEIKEGNVISIGQGKSVGEPQGQNSEGFDPPQPSQSSWC